jgi:soluble lytic murein transglycosylase-like protein
MNKLHRFALMAVAALPLSPALAADSAPLRPSVSRPALSTALDESKRSNYREIFAAIRASDWIGATTRLDAMGDGPLHAVARAEIYLGKGSPRVELDPLLALISKAPDLPHAERLAKLATTRGATTLPYLPQAQKLIWQSGQPRRSRADSVKGDPIAAALEPLIQPLIKDNQPQAAEALLAERQDALSPQALIEYRQRVGWSYYIIGNYADSKRLADLARTGTGDWALQAEWVAGLSSWRLRDCEAASNSFATVASRSTDQELSAAGHYWAARADMMCGRPERVQARLRSAARMNETFYGLLSASALGIKKPLSASLHDFSDAEWQGIAHKPNVRAAIALNEIGERVLADDLLKHQARIGSAVEHEALLHLAADLNLAGTQVWLAHNAPAGARINMAARYPAPTWQPVKGWRVDQSLAFAHALQESNFRTQVVSPVGASGLMQVRPGTAGDFARARGVPFDPQQLSDPAFNLEYGQSYLELLRDSSSTGGLLPKVIAAYNAGPVPIAAWNARRFDDGDPLLYIESIPYWETRGYVPIILRNYWVYEQKTGKESVSKKALAQGMWPKFPGASGPGAVRMVSRAAEEQVADGTH